MIKEKVIDYENSVSVKVASNEVTSVRFNNIMKNGYRVYENNYIGVCGQKGKVDDNEMFKQAQSKLENKVRYPYDPSNNLQINVDYSSEMLSNNEFINEIKELIKVLSNEFPNFIFSNSCDMINVNKGITNDVNLNLSFKDSYYSIELLIKDKESFNLMDNSISFIGRNYDKDLIIRDVHKLLDKYFNVVKIENKQYLVLISFDYFLTKFASDLRADIVGNNASIFSNKIKTKCFSDEFTLEINKDPKDNFGIEFFDSEGVVNKNYKYTLIKNGFINCAYSSKKESKVFDVELTGSANSKYDEVPSILELNIKPVKSNKTIEELTNSKEYIYVTIASGGDFTASGDYASPVQCAYLMKNKDIIGRIEDFNISSNIFKMFNEDFVSTPSDSILEGSNESLLLLKMNISK